MTVSFLQTYAKEIFSLCVPMVAWLLTRFLRARAKLQIAHPHTFTFLVNVPLLDNEGKTVRESQTIHTKSCLIMNSGSETATKLELVFNWKPACVNIWPPRHYNEHTEPDNRYTIIFDSLSPGEALNCEILSVNVDLPNLVTARCDQTTARFVDMHPQPINSQWVNLASAFLLMTGLATSIYILLLIIQFLVLKTPLGR